MDMMSEWLYGKSGKSTYHTTCVRRVKTHLKKFCIQGGEEKKFVEGRRIDAWGYDKNTKILYFCEIKVDPKDLTKGVNQIHDSFYNFNPPNSVDKVIPVIAIPKKLAEWSYKNETGKWRSFRALCKTTNITIWIIEQSNIVQIQGPKPKAPKKITRKTSTKVKVITKRKTIAKRKTTKSHKTATKSTPKPKRKSTTKAKTIKKRRVTTKRKTTKTRIKKAKKKR